MKAKVGSNRTIPYHTSIKTAKINLLQWQLKVIKSLISNNLSENNIVMYEKDTLPRQTNTLIPQCYVATCGYRRLFANPDPTREITNVPTTMIIFAWSGYVK